MAVQPAAAHPWTWSASSVSVRLVNPPHPYTGTVVPGPAEQPVREMPSTRALRSQRAMSTALIACMTRPRVPRLRQARCIADQEPGMSRTSRPVIAAARWSVITIAAAAVLYVQPRPCRFPACTVTVTAVVASQRRVPSASGPSVGNRYTATVTASMAVSGAGHACTCRGRCVGLDLPGGQPVGGPGGQRHDGQRRVGGALGRQDAAVGDEQVRDGEAALVAVDDAVRLVGRPSGRRRRGGRTGRW